MIGITGRIQTRNYENQQGQRVYVTEVIADNFQMLESRASREGNNSGGFDNNLGNTSGAFGNSSNAGGSFGGGMTGNTPNFGRDESPFGNTNPLDISDDDLPF